MLSGWMWVHVGGFPRCEPLRPSLGHAAVLGTWCPPRAGLPVFEESSPRFWACRGGPSSWPPRPCSDPIFSCPPVPVQGWGWEPKAPSLLPSPRPGWEELGPHFSPEHHCMGPGWGALPHSAQPGHCTPAGCAGGPPTTLFLVEGERAEGGTLVRAHWADGQAPVLLHGGHGTCGGLRVAGPMADTAGSKPLALSFPRSLA